MIHCRIWKGMQQQQHRIYRLSILALGQFNYGVVIVLMMDYINHRHAYCEPKGVTYGRVT